MSIQNGRKWILPNIRTLFAHISFSNNIIHLKVSDFHKVSLQKVKKFENNFSTYKENEGKIAEIVYCAVRGTWVLYSIRLDLKKASSEEDLRKYYTINLDNVTTLEIVSAARYQK